MQLRHFTLAEFDSPDAPGSGVNMHASTVGMLDEARERFGKPIHINSGYRTKEYNASLKDSVPDSAHTLGFAADLSGFGPADIEKLLKALYEVGFRRFGIGASYIHVDNDASKPTPAVWKYSSTNPATWAKYGNIQKIAALCKS